MSLQLFLLASVGDPQHSNSGSYYFRCILQPISASPYLYEAWRKCTVCWPRVVTDQKDKLNNLDIELHCTTPCEMQYDQAARIL